MLMGVIAASVPPVIITSASLAGWFGSIAMALAALAQAVATAVLGPAQAEHNRKISAGCVYHHFGNEES